MCKDKHFYTRFHFPFVYKESPNGLIPKREVFLSKKEEDKHKIRSGFLCLIPIYIYICIY